MTPDSRFATSSVIDSDLGFWTHTEWRPPVAHPLAWAVERVWDFEGATAHRRERVFPNGMVELIVQLDDRYRDVHGRVSIPTPFLCVTGIQPRAIVVEAPTTRVRVLGVRLHPAGAWALLGHPLQELTGITADLEDLLGRRARDLAGRCDDAATGGERVGRAAAWVADRLARGPTPGTDGAAVHHVAHQIAEAGGAVAVGELRGESGLSASRLARAFQEQVGVSPKRYARIHRFRRALDLVQTGARPLAEVALLTGYYDQPHMNAEFREMAGLTPRALRAAARYPASGSVVDADGNVKREKA